MGVFISKNDTQAKTKFRIFFENLIFSLKSFISREDLGTKVKNDVIETKKISGENTLEL